MSQPAEGRRNIQNGPLKSSACPFLPSLLPSFPAPKDCHVTYVPLLQPSAQSGQQRLIPGRRQSGPGRRGRGGIQFLRRPRHPHNFHPSPTDRGTDRRTRRERRACVSLTGPKANNLHLGHVSLLDHLRSELHHVAAHDGRPVGRTETLYPARAHTIGGTGPLRSGRSPRACWATRVPLRNSRVASSVS